MIGAGRILLILLSTITVVSGSAKGVKFLVAFLSNGPGSNDLQLIVFNPNEKEKAIVTVSSAVNSTVLTEKQVQGVDQLTAPYTYRMDTNGPNDKAILVRSTIPVLVSAKNSEAESTDKFLVIPLKNLGKRHVVLTHHDEKYMSEFALVATKNDTLVNITYPTGEPMSLILQQYESYREQSEGRSLMGTKIISSHPVAMFAGGMTTNFRNKLVGHIAEQLLSVEYWGRTFLTSPMSEQRDFLRIVGYNETTALRIWRNSTDKYEFHTVSPFQSLMIDMGAKGDDHLLVEANDTVLVGQFSLTNSENPKNKILGFTLVQPNEQFLPSYVVVSSGTGILTGPEYVRIVAQNNQEWLSQLPIYNLFESAFTSYQTAIKPLESGQQEFVGYQAFGMNLYEISFTDASSQLVNLRLEVLPENCVNTSLVQSDNFDNDCDGKVDEEIVDSMDNDGDRGIDEDTNEMLLNVTQANISITESLNVTTYQTLLNSSTAFLSTGTAKTTTKITHEASTSASAHTGEDAQGNESGSLTTTASGNQVQEEPITENPTQEYTNDNSLQEQNPTTTDRAAKNGTSVTGNVVQHTTDSDNDVPLDGSVTGSSPQYEMTTADHAAPRDGSLTGNQAQYDTTTADHAAPRDGSVTGNQAQYDTTTANHDAPRDGSLTGNPQQYEMTTAGHVVQRETPAAGTRPPRDITPPDDMGKEVTSVENAVKQRTTNAADVKHEETIGPGIKRDLTTAREAVDNLRETVVTTSPPDTTPTTSGTNVGKSAVQSAANVEPAVQKESTDDIGILTIVAPSFICGVPFLIIVICCFRSIMAGVCRKKVYPKEKKFYQNVQPVRIS